MRRGGMTTFKAGLLAATVIGVFAFFGFTRYNPFANPFQLKATFQSANNLQPKSPVRIAGIDVGRVIKVEPLKNGSGTARVTMQLDKKALPIHKDAELKIRPRIFLEGNFFVDLQPGSPESGSFHSGDTVPVQQTATPVQFGQVLEALQSDTRSDLQTFLKEYAEKGLGNGGAKAYNKLLDNAPSAARYASIANQASLGTEPHDLSKLLRGQQKLFHALSTNPETLKSLVVNLNSTAGAFAREDTALAATVPALRDVVTVGRPALVSLNNALPTLRAFARDALPGTISSGPTLDRSLPFITQARLLVRKQELRGLARDLKSTIPSLAKVNRTSIPLLDQQRALSACQNNVILPFSHTPVPDPDFPAFDGANGQPPYKEIARGLVGLSGESRFGDANGQTFHIQFGSGPSNVLYTDAGQTFVAQAPGPPEGVRPVRPNRRPQFRPDVPCETQQTPDLHANGGGPDQTVTANGVPLVPGLPIPPLPHAKQTKEQLQFTEALKSFAARTAKGQYTPDPFGSATMKDYSKAVKQAHLRMLPSGRVVGSARMPALSQGKTKAVSR